MPPPPSTTPALRSLVARQRCSAMLSHCQGPSLAVLSHLSPGMPSHAVTHPPHHQQIHLVTRAPWCHRAVAPPRAALSTPSCRPLNPLALDVAPPHLPPLALLLLPRAVMPPSPAPCRRHALVTRPCSTCPCHHFAVPWHVTMLRHLELRSAASCTVAHSCIPQCALAMLWRP
ncbi:hypothetical protein DENSPDRAFT_886265 [Dentipellis sp. KUC8613]|nr:hypothetical protein DENSPDRAFT_886265 [Dentipellis sp. KUC8613]